MPRKGWRGGDHKPHSLWSCRYTTCEGKPHWEFVCSAHAKEMCRRDTSEESGGEASGSSPTAGAGRAKALRRSASKNRHKRPPLRAPAFEVWLQP